MNDRRRFVAVSINTMVFAWLLAGCGDYGDGAKKGTGGASGSTATGGASGTATGGASGTATGGASGSSAQAGSGGSGMPTGGTSGAGGSSGAGTGGAQGGSGGQVSCSDVAACGGDVLGTWTAASCMLTVSGMADMSVVGLGCTTVPVTGSLHVSGTWTAMAGGMYSDSTTTSGQEVLELPASCLMVSGTVTTCDRVVLDPMGLTSVVCVDNAATSGCTCTATVNQTGGLALVSLDAATSGTYTSADNELVTTAAGVDTEYSYCVAGNTLTMKLTTVGKAGPAMGPIVLQKQ